MKFLLAIIFTFTWWMPFLFSYLTNDPIKTSIADFGLLLVIMTPVLFLLVSIVAYTQGQWSSGVLLEIKEKKEKTK